jgi:hypothetical protein
MERLDTDGDGSVQISDVEQSRLRDRLTAADANGDGAVTLEELEAHQAANPDAGRRSEGARPADAEAASPEAEQPPPQF